MSRRFCLACICILLALPGLGWAQTAAPGGALAVELSVPFGTIPGKLLLLGNYLVFVDENQLDTSFVVPKSAIETLSADGSAITVQTTEAIRNRSGESRRLSFRVATGTDPAVVTIWYGRGGQTASGTASAAPAVDTTTYQARHNHRIGDCRGQVIVNSDRVSYESVSSVSHSRRWEYRGIREIELPNPYELEIKSFTGESYKLKLDGEGMNPAAYKQLVDRVVSARANR